MLTKDEEAIELARRHYEIDEGISTIIRIRGCPETEIRSAEPIKLLEVNQNTVPSGVMPLQFGSDPASGFHFPSIIVEVTPTEYEMIRRNELKLPLGWILSDAMPRPETGAVR